MRSTQTADGIKDGKDVLLGRFVSQRPYVAHLMAGANAKAESFMKTLKCEHVYLNEYRNFAEVFERVAAFIDQVYNPRSFTEFILRHKASPLSTLRAFGCAEGFRAALKGPSRGRHLCSRDVFGLHAQQNHTAQAGRARYFATARAPFGKLRARLLAGSGRQPGPQASPASGTGGDKSRAVIHQPPASHLDG